MLLETRGHDRTSPRSSPAPELSPGARFDGFRRPESHVVLHRRPERASWHVTSLYALTRFGIALALAFATSPRRTCLRCDATGTSPEGAAFVDGAHHFFTPRRLATTRCNIMASNVGRGLRATACRQPKVPCALLLKGVVRSGIPSSQKEAPNTLCHRPGCVCSWSAANALACYPLADQDLHSRRPPRRRKRSRRPGCLDPIRKKRCR